MNKNIPMENRNMAPSKGEIVIYQTRDKKVQLEVKLEQDTVWLTQKQIAELFKVERTVITKHLGNIFKSKELDQDSVCAKIAHTASDGKVYQTTFYNLDMIISVGYRVNSTRATQFRIWATNVLRKHLIDGYTINEQRLNQQTHKLQALQRAIKLIGNIKDKKQLEYKEALGLLYREDGSKRIADNALVALTLMIAESDPKERDVIVMLTVNLINRNN